MTSPKGMPLERVSGPLRSGTLSRASVTAMASIVLASHLVLGSFIADNWGLYEFSAYHLLPSACVCLLGAVALVCIKRTGGSVDAAGISLSIGALVALAGGSLSDILGPLAVLVVPGVVALTYRAVNEVFTNRSLRWTANLIPAALLLPFGFWASGLPLSTPEEPTGVYPSPVTSPHSAVTGLHPDVYFLVLDELASTETAPLDVSSASILDKLSLSGFNVEETAWSGYTVSAAAIAAILDGAYPLADGDYLDERALRRLGRITRGDNRLFREARNGGYHITMIESGLWMTSCDGIVDNCGESGVFDEAMGVLLAQSAADWWYRTWWGDAMVQSGLRSMSSARDAMLALTDNGRADLLFAHLLLPHVPYVLDSDCELHEHSHESYISREERLAAYQSQAGCVLSWLGTTIEEVDAASEEIPTVVVVGDHGTNLAGQLTFPVKEWGSQEIAERLAAFSAMRLPESCPDRQLGATPQLTRHLISCLWGISDAVPARHFLLSYGDDPPRALEYPHHLLPTSAERG